VFLLLAFLGAASHWMTTLRRGFTSLVKQIVSYMILVTFLRFRLFWLAFATLGGVDVLWELSLSRLRSKHLLWELAPFLVL